MHSHVTSEAETSEAQSQALSRSRGNSRLCYVVEGAC